ncbi:hypothetical protein ZTR_03072 [Talaromyces verruculosus]|nr:hypothetical protein ZTR_03072 [Talaromyces verruculosus]
MSAQQPGKERSIQSPPSHTSSTPITSPPPVSTSTATAYQPSSSSVLSLPATTDQSLDPEAIRRTLEARTAFTASLHAVGQTVSADLRARATDLHENAAAIQKQEQELARHTAELAKQNDQWDKVVDGARQGLKEIGDVQNWAEMIERDLLVVEDVLRQVEGHAFDGEGEEGDVEYREDRLHEEEEEEEDGSLTEREDEDRKKAAQEPVDILDDVSSSASGITGTSATSGTVSESSGKSSPPDQDGGKQQIKARDDTGKKTAGGWWRWWW